MKKVLYLLLAFTISSASAQQASTGTTAANYPAPINCTAEQDHQHMMKPLGIKVLRPGPGGDVKAIIGSNYDQVLANP
ncbi:hypothetical protein [Rufibacter sp. XAAS-G3-1]|uniref:hypothetical protein n=1 Tax=Rufibacter sp. XAAS-G3-1 TaxID=2729134 RepID=UPI0015E6A7BC|nr:hypothetical protein [Rufibacter sp. XAAS-G3-1]